jgi:hypothetical protein
MDGAPSRQKATALSDPPAWSLSLVKSVYILHSHLSKISQPLNSLNSSIPQNKVLLFKIIDSPFTPISSVFLMA